MSGVSDGTGGGVTAKKVLLEQSHVASDESGAAELDLGCRYSKREQ